MILNFWVLSKREESSLLFRVEKAFIRLFNFINSFSNLDIKMFYLPIEERVICMVENHKRIL